MVALCEFQDSQGYIDKPCLNSLSSKKKPKIKVQHYFSLLINICQA